MNELKIFENKELGKIRVEIVNKEVYFVVSDVLKVLGLKNTTETLKRLDEDELSSTEVIDTIGRKQKAYVVNESGLYNLIFQSRKESAKFFKKWVTNEVLPSIRKTGGYILGQETLSEEDLFAKALIVAENRIKEKQKEINNIKIANAQLQVEIDSNKPKVLFADSLRVSNKSILIGELAKILNQNGYEIGQNRLFDKLRKEGYLGNRGNYYNLPTQKASDLKIFEIKTSVIINPDGSNRITKTTKVTAKGQIYFINKFLKEEMI